MCKIKLECKYLMFNRGAEVSWKLARVTDTTSKSKQISELKMAQPYSGSKYIVSNMFFAVHFY
jgi:hypothetical protein